MHTNQKKILIVSRSFYPMNSPRSFRTTELAKEFARQGHEVTVLTPKDPEVHPDFERKHHLTIKDLGQRTWKPVEIRGKGIERLIRRAARRFPGLLFQYPDIQLMWRVQQALKKETRTYDLLISVAVPYPVHWGVAKAWNKGRNVANVWVADCGDPFMGAKHDTFTKPFYFKYVEQWFCRKADHITVPAKDSLDGYYEEFHHKIKVIPQGFRFEDLQTTGNTAPNPIPSFAYAGSFIPGMRDPAELLTYLQSLDLDFRFQIYTRQHSLVESAWPVDDKRLEIKDFVPRGELLRRLSEMDFVVNFENQYSTATPSKLIDYAILEKPILPVKTGALDTQLVDQFLNGDYSGRFVVQNPDQYRIENVSQKFLELTQ
jgi:glycosyltransferase involved in cell wall biosynthesis